MAIVGRSHRRVEGAGKTTGDTRFTADLRIAHMAHTRLVLSQHAHARFRLDASAALIPGVAAVVTGADLEGVDFSGGYSESLASGEVFYVGQPVAAVIAETVEVAADAAALVQVEYEPLPAILDPERAMEPGAPPVLPNAQSGLDAATHGISIDQPAAGGTPPNVTLMSEARRGEPEAAFAEAAALVSRRYYVPPVHQAFLEPHATVAEPHADGTITIWTATQGSFLARGMTAGALGLPLASVRIVPMAVGGGFGGKICLLEPLVAALARHVRRPVRLELTRTEEFLMGRGGPSATIDVKLSAGRDGDLTGLWARAIFDDGAGPGDHAPVAVLALGGTYRIPNLDLAAYDVNTHKTPVGAYRAPGGPQATFAIESAVDEIATTLGIDPIDLRMRNASREGDLCPDGSAWPRIGLVECLEEARRLPLLAEPRAPGEGIGVAVGGWGGATGPATASCRLDADGTLTLQVGSVDLTGTDTSLAMIAAETFGCRLEDVRLETGDTATAPYSTASGGSKILYTVGPAVALAAADARRQLLELAAEELEASPQDLVVEDGEVRVSGVPSRSRSIASLGSLVRTGGVYAPVQGQGRSIVADASPMFTVHVARVRVDAEAGSVAVTGYAAIQDVGRAINPAEIEGQVHGGIVQGLGRVLGEEVHYTPDGQVRTTSFLDYQLPSIDQAPAVEVGLVEVPSPSGPLGAKGVGEPPAIPGAAAVANAIHDATGVRVARLPFDAEALSAAAITSGQRVR